MLQRYLKAVLLLFLVAQSVVAQQAGNKQYRLSGIVTNAAGERLEGAFVVITPGDKGLLTNKYGRFSTKLEKGTY